MQEYIEGAPHRIKVGCFAGGAAIVLNGFLSVIDVFDAPQQTVRRSRRSRPDTRKDPKRKIWDSQFFWRFAEDFHGAMSVSFWE